MGAVEDVRSTGTDAWVGHVVGVGIGVAAAAAVVALTWWEKRLRTQSVVEASAAPLWILMGLFALTGAAVVVPVLLSPRVPSLPTAAAVALSYSLLASFPSELANVLPFPAPIPRMQGGFTAIALVTGVMAAAAVQGWASYAGGGPPRRRSVSRRAQSTR